MSKQERVALAIKEVISKMMDRVIENVLLNDPFVKETYHASKPLYAALVPDEIFKSSHFEKRFVIAFYHFQTLSRVKVHDNFFLRKVFSICKLPICS